MQYLTAGTLDPLVPPLKPHTDQQRSASGLRLPLKPLPLHAKAIWETVGDATSGAVVCIPASAPAGLRPECLETRHKQLQDSPGNIHRHLCGS
jgi:hypothetical protein